MKRGATLVLHIASDHSQASGCANSLCVILEHPRPERTSHSAPPRPAALTHTSQCKRARREPRAPAHPATPPPPAQPGTDPPGALPPALEHPGLPLSLSRLRARTRTHALPAPPHREGAQASGGGEPRAESWVHPALGFRAVAPAWPWSPDREQLAVEIIYSSFSSRRPYTSRTPSPAPKNRPKSESPNAARSGFPTPRPKLAGWWLDFRKTPDKGLL